MTLQSFLVLLPSMISGGIAAHLIWPDRGFKSVFFKLFLGIGLGLGINSLLYFFFLLIFNNRSGFFWLQVLLMVVLVFVFVILERPFRVRPVKLQMSALKQVPFLILVSLMVVFALIVYVTISRAKPQGAWDSWMIYNRAARFIFRGGDHWKDAFSPAMYWFFHADYPPMLALNVASGWDVLGQETVRVPMLIGGVFLFASAGVMFAGLNAYKTIGQASLALLALFSISDYIDFGAKQVADVPVAFFILTTGILIFLYPIKEQKGILVLAGLSAGLAAWTKNEGIFFILATLLGLGFAYRNQLKQVFSWYLLGLAVPVLFLMYFKIALAPPGDLFVDLASQIRQVIDWNRHAEILKQLRSDLMSLVNWALLLVYALVLGVDRARFRSSAFVATLVIILLQLIGYYGILLISPHPILWHLSALYRLLLQIGPLIVFAYFAAVKPPETVFQAK